MIAEMASLGKRLQHTLFIFTARRAGHVTQSCFSLVVYKAGSIMQRELLVLLCGNFFQRSIWDANTQLLTFARYQVFKRLGPL